MLSPADKDARTAALLLAANPGALKGAIVYGTTRALCEQWLEALVSLLPAGAPVRRVPSNISEERLLGGLDFSATISQGRAVSERGVLAEANTGALVLSASTTRTNTWAHVARTLDTHAVPVERDGLSELHETVFALVAVQTADDEPVAASVADRVAFVIDLDGCSRTCFPNTVAATRESAASNDVWSPAQVMAVRARLNQPQAEAEQALNDEALEALVHGAARLGIASPRLALLALAVARTHAALHDRTLLDSDDVACAARLVLAPRATAPLEMPGENPPDAPQPIGDPEPTEPPRELPPDAPGSPEIAPPPPPTPEAPPGEPPDGGTTDVGTMADVVVRVATAAIPTGMLAAAAARVAGSRSAAGRSGVEQQGGTRGRQVGTRRGDPRGGARLDLVATLRAAIPLQRIRRAARAPGSERLVELRRDDFRIRRCSTPATTTTLFVVDASGSAALNRLAEAKGAIELMLAEGYARRDRVAVIAFRGTVAELVLPSTHALARARRAVAGMPAGGGTPLAAALDLAAQTVEGLRRDCAQVVTVILTDGRANVGRDGKGGRARAETEALDAAKRLGALRCDVVWIDTSARSEALSRGLADATGARYLLLPQPNARGVRDVVRAAQV